MVSFLPFKIYSERQTRKRKAECWRDSRLENPVWSSSLALPHPASYLCSPPSYLFSLLFSFSTQPSYPSDMPSASYLPSAAPSTKSCHFFPSWFRMPQHHFNLFLWALVFNLFPNLILDPSSLRLKKKKERERLCNLTIPLAGGSRKDSRVLLPH